MTTIAALRSKIAGLPDTDQQDILRMFESVAAPAPSLSERELEADHRDLVRTLNKVLKPQRPSPYRGEHDADSCQNFIDNQEEYYSVVKLAQDQWVQYTALNLIDHHLRVSEWMERRALPAGTTRNRGMGVKLVSGAISAVMRRALAGAWPYPDRTARRTDSPAVIIAHIAIFLVTTRCPQTLPWSRLHLHSPRLNAGNSQITK